MATKRVMIHDDIKADTLLTREIILCMMVYVQHDLWLYLATAVFTSAMAAAPPPQHLLRSHSSPVGALFTSGDNERIYSGDSSGKVVVTSTRSLRAITQWNAHTDSILGVEEWDKHIVTYVVSIGLFTLPLGRFNHSYVDMPEIINFTYGKGLRKHLSLLDLVALLHYLAYLFQHYVTLWMSTPSTFVVFRCSNWTPVQKKKLMH